MILMTFFLRAGLFCLGVLMLPLGSAVSFAEVLPQSAPLFNQLKSSPSPYLALHGEDPVTWQEWGPETIALARNQNKLLFVSIGYFSCHWCHVMQAESYRNPEVAALINKNFIPVKVDRELAVALDAEMIAFAQSTLGSAGWPLNVFITPEGYPLYATLYEKPEQFSRTLLSLSTEWTSDDVKLKSIARSANKVQQAIQKVKPSVELASAYREQLVHETVQLADVMSGGMNLPRKFPIAPQLSALLEIESIQHNAKLSEWLRLTLDQMMNGGLRDHLAGGFFRYTVDPLWQQPHFEKMLYDNVQLATIYLRAAKLFNAPVYQDVAIETLDFLLKEMRQDAVFITSISALDGNGAEGGAYLWSERQLRDVLDNNEFNLVVKIWGMDGAAEFDLGFLPMNRIIPKLFEQERLKGIYAKLLAIRELRITPKDTKLLSALNGLALSTFSNAAYLAPRYRQAADELHNMMIKHFWQDDVLYKGISAQQRLGQGDFESYAYVSAGLFHYAQLSKRAVDVQVATHITRLAWQKFHQPLGFLLEQKSELARPYYQAVVEDGPLPSPSSTLIATSLGLGGEDLDALSLKALADSGAMKGQGMFWYSSQVIALNKMFEGRVKP